MADEKYRLGLDLGTNSMGWAAVRLDGAGNPCGVLDMGVRIFPDGRNPQDKTSLAVQRRIPRGARRRRDRYIKRRSALMDELIVLELMPGDEGTRKGLERLDPYRLRAMALDHPLKPFELGRALFHLDQRRGFKSNRKAEAKTGDDEAQKTRAEIDKLRRSIAESGARTLGEFLARRHASGLPVRARAGEGLYPDRALYEAEFDAIRAEQEERQSLRPEQWDALRDIIFYQRPLKPVEPGWCLFEPGERRAPRALPLAQEFRMLQEINNLRLLAGFEPERALTSEERARVLARLRSGRDINLKKKPTRDLGLPSDAIFNLSRGGRSAVKGDEITARLARKGPFGERWLELLLDERNEIVRVLLETEDPEAVRVTAIADWGLTNLQASSVAEITLPDGHANLSEKAIRKIIPFMEEQGLGYSDAVIAAGYEHHSDFRNPEAHSSLPYYGEVLERDVVGANPEADDGDAPARYGRIANPTVHIGLNQVRRVVNRLIETHGKPVEIIVELARDLKANREQRDRYRREQQQGADRNTRFRKMIEDAEQQVTAEALHKLRLWEEQGPPQARICPYSGRTLSFEMVMSAATEVDHILPFSRTLDNSRANMVVCVVDANRDKGNRTPYEAFGHSPAGYDYEGILSRTAPPGFPDNKSWRFRENAMERFEGDRDFLDRQLNETRYLSRTARTYLAHLYNEKDEGSVRVRVIPGRMTALLRRSWELEGMLRETKDSEPPRKQRDDHRHHAIDAFVVANTTQGLLASFSQAAGHGEERLHDLLKIVPLPWPGFHKNDMRPFLDRMIISYKPDHGTRGRNGKTTGQLHKETAYGLVEELDDGAWQVVVRKPLAAMTRRNQLEAVRDPALREALLVLWDATLGMGGKPAEFAEKAATEGISMGGKRVRVRRVRVLDKQRVITIRDREGRAYKGYVPGGNEFADVWRLPDGSWQIVAVPRFDANQIGFDPARFRPHPAAKRLMRLHIDDPGAIGTGAERRIVRVRKITAARAGTFVVLDDHNEANVAARVGNDMKENRYSARQLQREGFRKVGVDETGRLLDPGPRSRSVVSLR